MDIQPIAKNMIWGLLERGGPRVHAALALTCGLILCFVLVAFTWARIKGLDVRTEFMATLGVFTTLTGYIWKTGKDIEAAGNDPAVPPTLGGG